MEQLICIISVAAFGAAPGPSTQIRAEAQGEFRARIEMVRDRMLKGDVPRFTEDFILADVALKPEYPRRFSNYSGDLSGRYVGALACMPGKDTDAGLRELVAHLLKYQRADGRFGAETLSFAPEAVALDQMALLWGNGRLLVGLLEYYATAAPSDPEVLAASRRLGGFLLRAADGCANEQVVQAVKDLGAAGMICLSQIVEGLVMLHNATGDAGYLAGAEKIVPWLPKDRGTQHSHGYLTTLRGILMLYEADHKVEYLKMVEDLYAGLVHSPDYTVYGGVCEYFGGNGDRDEGCSEADLLRLSLQLWRVTGKRAYLDQAEHCLLNEFYANQFATGDFGHHTLSASGLEPFAGRAWWCCTMHGLRAFRDVLDSVVTADEDAVRLNLFLDATWTDGARSLIIETHTEADRRSDVAIRVKRAPADGLRLAVRAPEWSVKTTMRVNKNAVAVTEENGYARLPRALHAGDRVELSFEYQCRIVKKDGAVLTPDQLGSAPVDGALFCGPWLLGVDAADNPLYFGEPWQANRVELPLAPVGTGASTSLLSIPKAHVATEYVHDGFPGKFPVVLRPVSERSLHEPASFAVWLHFCRPG